MGWWGVVGKRVPKCQIVTFCGELWVDVVDCPISGSAGPTLYIIYITNLGSKQTTYRDNLTMYIYLFYTYIIVRMVSVFMRFLFPVLRWQWESD